MANAAFTTVHSAQLRDGINAAVDSPCPTVAASYSGNIKATVVAVRTTASKALLPLCLGVTRVDCRCLGEGVGWGRWGVQQLAISRWLRRARIRQLID